MEPRLGLVQSYEDRETVKSTVCEVGSSQRGGLSWFERQVQLGLRVHSALHSGSTLTCVPLLLSQPGPLGHSLPRLQDATPQWLLEGCPGPLLRKAVDEVRSTSAQRGHIVHTEQVPQHN